MREYWIIDPRPGKQRVDLYVLDARGRYQPVPPSGDGMYRSTVLPMLYLREDWLWADKPNPLVALAQIIGVERVNQALQGSA